MVAQFSEALINKSSFAIEELCLRSWVRKLAKNPVNTRRIMKFEKEGKIIIILLPNLVNKVTLLLHNFIYSNVYIFRHTHADLSRRGI